MKIYIVNYCPMMYEPDFIVAILQDERKAIEYCIKEWDRPHKDIWITVWELDDEGSTQLKDETIQFAEFPDGGVWLGRRAIGTAYSREGIQILIQKDSGDYQEYQYSKDFNNEDN